MTALPAELKSSRSLVARADELESKEPAIAYWARYWLVQKVILAQDKRRSTEVETYLVHVLEQLEMMKTTYAGDPEIEDSEIGRLKVEKFALQVFENADKEERASKADRNTSLKFLAASTFLEICQAFGSPEKDLVDKRKYAKVQAMRIQSAIVAGKDPNEIRKLGSNLDRSQKRESAIDSIPSEPLETNSFSDHGVSQEANLPEPSGQADYPTFDLGVDNSCTGLNREIHTDIKNSLTGTPSPGPDMSPEFVPDHSIQIDTLPQELSRQATPELIKTVLDGPSVEEKHATPHEHEAEAGNMLHLVPDAEAIESAQKHAKWAISALNYEDIDTAVLELKKALVALELKAH